MSRRRCVPVVAGLLALSAAVAGAATLPGFAWRASPSPYRVYSAGGTLPVTGATGKTGTLRATVILPASWKRTTKDGRSIMRFGPIGSCRFVVTIRGRMVQTTATTATARAASQIPATGRYVLESGTRQDAAFRVIRVAGTKTVRGILVQPLPASSSGGAPSGQRVYSELVAEGIADPRTECHSGGPRSIGSGLGTAFAAGSAGGFVLR